MLHIIHAHVIVPQRMLLILWKFECRLNRHETAESFIITRKCGIRKCGPETEKSKKKCKHEKQLLSTMVLTKHFSLERLCSSFIFYVSCKKAFLAFCRHKFSHSIIAKY